MLTGALRLSSHRVQDFIVTTCDKAFMLSSRTRLDKKTVETILLAGYSRIPVYLNDNRRHILGTLIVQSLVILCFTNPNKPPRAGEYPLLETLRLPASTTLYNSYLAFQKNSSNMAVVYDNCGVMVGLWTLTDLLCTLYNTSPAHEGSNTHRQELMVTLLESMKAMNAARRKAQGNVNSAIESEEFFVGGRKK
ncbi:CBS domain containing protein [Trypanosoma cruzi]|uniref:CBS domain containing protein n=1 Tax=Trypanosoma cruzi TaxID=5693 RepID=A0A2V2XA51_TRYCR|nr:CBS domain containing protein [Trypanosoma cruzi]